MSTIDFFEKPIIKAKFLERKNRFVVKCKVKNEVISAYLPNSGRLFELLYRGAEIYLSHNRKSSNFKYIVVGVNKSRENIMLHTHMSNKVFKYMLEKNLIKDFCDYKIVKEEFAIGNSRFDFLIEKNQKRIAIEVKTCTLFHDKIAMFPDAITGRGTKHISELANLRKNGIDGALIFLIQSKNVDYFLPEFNVDLDFSKSLLEIKDKILVKAFALRWDDNFMLDEKIKEVLICWDVAKKHTLYDSGAYFLILFLKNDLVIDIGELGKIFFKKGYYLYVGSGKKGLTKRIERHKRINKKLFWHIDYLRPHCEFVNSITFRTGNDLECLLANRLKVISDWEVKNFGSSDCKCSSHLFSFKKNPMEQRKFIDLVMHYRIGILKNEIDLLEY